MNIWLGEKIALKSFEEVTKIWDNCLLLENLFIVLKEFETENENNKFLAD